MPKFSYLIFDLDGTLVDSLPGIEASIRHASATVLPEVPVPDVRAHIGPPIAAMFAQLWPQLDTAVHNQLVSAFREHYDQEGCRLSQLYPEVAETLAALRAEGVTMFVVTNKPQQPTRTILGETGLRSYFQEIISPDSVAPPFESKSAAVADLCERYRLEPTTTAVVGDGRDDAAAAAHCGFPFILAGYGYGGAALDGARAAISHLDSFGPLLTLLRIP